VFADWDVVRLEEWVLIRRRIRLGYRGEEGNGFDIGAFRQEKDSGI
jgi:hypothetical protein